MYCLGMGTPRVLTGLAGCYMSEAHMLIFSSGSRQLLAAEKPVKGALCSFHHSTNHVHRRLIQRSGQDTDQAQSSRLWSLRVGWWADIGGRGICTEVQLTDTTICTCIHMTHACTVLLHYTFLPAITNSHKSTRAPLSTFAMYDMHRSTCLLRISIKISVKRLRNEFLNFWRKFYFADFYILLAIRELCGTFSYWFTTFKMWYISVFTT